MINRPKLNTLMVNFMKGFLAMVKEKARGSITI